MSDDFFQCLICKLFFDNSWKAERHIKLHNETETTSFQQGSSELPTSGRRRGMLPIRKVHFPACSVPIVRNQIDPAFLQNYIGLEANDDDDATNVKKGRKPGRPRKSKCAGEVTLDEFECRAPRQMRLKARDRIRQAAAILTVPDQNDANDDDDLDFVENVLKDTTDDYYRDDEFIPYNYKNSQKGDAAATGPKKRGRPKGWRKPEAEKQKKERSIKKTRRHKKRSREENLGSRKCSYCDERFTHLKYLNNHLVEKHRDDVQFIICPVSPCGKPCINHYAISSHLKLHCLAEQEEERLLLEQQTTKANIDEKPNPDKIITELECKFCLIKCSDLSRLHSHQNEVHDMDSHSKCPCCEESFGNGCRVHNLISHIKLYHPDYFDPLQERLKRAMEYKEKKRDFKCNKCDKAFVYQTQLTEHSLTHDKDKNKTEERRPFPCPVCHKGFRYRDNLRRHFTLHLENNPFVCDFPNCKRKFNSDYNLRRHQTLHYASIQAAERVNCPICNASFSRKDKLPRHIRIAHSESDITNGLPNKLPPKVRLRAVRVPRYPTYPVGVTPILNDTPKPLNINETGNTSVQKDVDCDTNPLKVEHLDEIHLVDKILLSSDGNVVHVKGEHLSPEKSTIAKDLGGTSPAYQSDNSTINSQVPTPIAAYSTCLNNIISKDPLFKRLTEENPNVRNVVLPRSYNLINDKTFTCEECNAVFTRAWTLQLHLKAIHKTSMWDISKEGQINANIANSNSASQDSQQYGSEITLMCGTCAYTAKGPKDLDKHMKTHETLRKHRCHICGIPFTTKIKRKKHVEEIHQGVRNYPCKYCEKSFVSDHHKTTHEFRVHANSSGVKKKQCPICQRILAASSYRAHVKRHEQEKDHDSKPQCMLCGDKFSCLMSLRRHIDCVHLGKPLNKRKKDVSRKNAGHAPGTVVRRGPKKAGDAWFAGLLDTATVVGDPYKKDKCDGSRVAENTELSHVSTQFESDETEMSILGF